MALSYQTSFGMPLNKDKETDTDTNDRQNF